MGTQNVGEIAGHFGVTRKKIHKFVEFADRNRPKVINTFVKKKREQNMYVPGITVMVE